MSTPVLLPKLSTSADDMVLVRWLRTVGDAVAAEQPLAEVETDKAVVELVAPAAGYLRQQLVQPGSRVSIGEPVALLTETLEEPLELRTPEEAPAGPQSSAEFSSSDRAHVSGPPPSVPDPLYVSPAHAGRFPISPVARKRARELGIAVDGLRGSGPGGRILLPDVEAAAEGIAATVSTASGDKRLAGKRVPLDRIRSAMASRMTLSARTVPQFDVSREADVTAVLALRHVVNGHLHRGRKLSLIDFVTQAVARTLQEHPYLNASFESSPGESAAIVLHESVNIGLATATPAGLLVPVIVASETMTLVELASARRAAVKRALDGQLSQADLSSGTFTISNLGPLGADSFTAMINPPQAAILAVGRTIERPVVHDGEIVVRSMVSLSVTADHRVVDGAAATDFLLGVVRILENSSDWNLA